VPLNIRDEAQTLQPQLVEWRRTLHACPELKNQTFKTADIIVRELRKIGIEEISERVGGSGVTAVIRGSKPGKCLGIRADCDGLPIREETGLPFASQNGNMHACGHDAHVAMALGAAKIIFNHRDRLTGSVKMIFQPYEEGDGGAKAMIADGIMKNPAVDAIIALHTGNTPTIANLNLTAGEVACSLLPISANITAFWARFKGLGAHVASPHLSRDPVLMACNAVVQLQALMSRERDPSSMAIVSVSRIDGGVRNNIIPEECYVEGSIRSLYEDEQKYYYQRVVEIFSSVAQGMRGSVEVGQVINLMAAPNDPEMLRIFNLVAPRIVGAEHVKEIRTPDLGGEDFARFAELVPSLYFRHSARYGDERDYPHHHPKFDLCEDGFWTGSAIFAQFAMDWQAL
jgi:amidohydrolase